MQQLTSAAFFDFDKTLVDCNSANRWFMYEVRGGRLPISYALRIPIWTMQYRMGSRNLEGVFVNAFRTVKGQPEADMIPRVRQWFDGEILPHARPGAQEAIRKHRTAGERLVVATSSSQYVGQLAMEAFALDDFVSTRLEVVEGLYTGEVTANAMGAGKAKLVEAWALAHAVDLTTCTFYTDSITDLELLKRVGHPVAVNPDRRLEQAARANGWPVVDWGRANGPT